jgi:TolB-like protein/DNA-binding winged helix-turn-helix (wHTH) protein
MLAIPNQPRVVKFGVFEVDFQSGEVRKSGMKQKLAGQPFQVLQALLENPHEIVTRERLRQRLWPENTFVDYDLALKKAVNRLREVLGDSAENPHFIETIPRQGYRFIGAIDAVHGPEKLPAPATLPSTRRALRQWIIGASLGSLALLLFVFNAGKLRTRIFAGSRPPEIHSLAVLPLSNLSGDPEQEYFADGMTDELITDLAQISALRVISRTSVMHYKGTTKTLPQIARELNADAVLEGSVQRSGDQVRIRAQLIYAASDRHLWAESYEGSLRDVLDLQNKVATEIARQIKIQVTPEEKTRLASARPVNLEAH